METPYGSVLPSSLFSDADMRGFSSFNSRYQDFGLKVGVVTNVIETDDDRNTTGLFPEYDVAVVQQDQDVGYSLVVYRNCIRTDALGGVSEYFDVKLRMPDKIEDTGAADPKNQNGSVVIIQCLMGSSAQAIITGGVQHPKRQLTLDKETGHALIGEFNGLKVNIDKDGAFSVVFVGATDNDGKPLKADVGGSFFKITANGSIEIGDNNGEVITLDKEKQTLTITSKKEMTITAGADMMVGTEGQLSVSAKKDMIAAIEGAVSVKGKQLTLEIGGSATILSKGMDISAGQLLKAQATQIILDGMVSVGGSGGLPALIFTSKFIGIGNLGGPVISSSIGPYSSRVRIT